MVAQLDYIYCKTRPGKALTRLISYGFFEGRPLTTRGRWINPMVFAHFAIEKRLPALKTVKKPVFILGTGRSGTTILGIVLSMHRDVGFLNEPKALWHAIYPYEDIIGNYTSREACYRLNEEDATLQARRNAHRLFGAYLTATFSKRVVDKYPELIFRVPFVKSLFPDAKFIFIVRNGFHTCQSVEKWSECLGCESRSETHNWWGRNGRKWKLLCDMIQAEHEDLRSVLQDSRGRLREIDKAAIEWIVTMREGMRVQKRYPDSVLQVFYETLCRDPSRTMKEICSFAELEEDDRLIAFADSQLNPTPDKPPISLSRGIEKPFAETMKALGYSS